MCPGTPEESIHLSRYLQKVMKRHKEDRKYIVFLELSIMSLEQVQTRQEDIDRVYNVLQKERWEHVQIVPADIRIRGIHTQMTRILKAYYLGRDFPLVFPQFTTRREFETYQARLHGVIRHMAFRFPKLWKTFGFSDPTLYHFFEKEFSRLDLTRELKERYLDIIGKIPFENPAIASFVFQSKAYKSMIGHFLQLGATCVDLYVCGKILQTPKQTEIITFFGSRHFHTLKRFFHDYERFNQCQSDQTASPQKFKCLPFDLISQHLS